MALLVVYFRMFHVGELRIYTTLENITALCTLVYGCFAITALVRSFCPARGFGSLKLMALQTRLTATLVNLALKLVK